MRLRDLVAACLFASLTACSPPPGPTEPSFTGVWVGPLPVSATEQRTFIVELHERADLNLMGHLLGGTSRRTLLGALRSGDNALLVFELRDGGDAATPIALSGAISGDTLNGTAMLGSASYPVTWTRHADPLEVRSFIFAPDTSGGDEPAELAIVQDGAGAIVAGNFTSANCDFIGCGGAVTAFTEAPSGALTIAIATDGACAGTASISASFNAATLFYTGTWTHTDAGGCGSVATGGALIGGRDMGTRSTHVASVLANLGQLADDIEGGAAFTAPHPSVSSTYLHFGETASDFLAARNAEVAAHPSASVEFHNFTAVRTIVPTGHNPLLPATPGVNFSDTRQDVAGIYRSVVAGAPAQSGYFYIAEDAGEWRLNGNQVGEFDLPFAYAIGAERLLAPTGVADQPLHLSLGGWGAHFGPQTGHLEGNAKVDMMAQFVGAAADLTELANAPGGTPGVCDIGLAWPGSAEICGVYGGLSGELIRARIFRYRAPYAGTVTQILYEERPRPASTPETHYFDNVPHWSVRIRFPGGLSIRFGHLGQITGAVRAGLIAATGIDPDTYTPSSVAGAPDYCPPSPDRCQVDVLDGASFAIAVHDEIARAQTDAAPIPAHPGYYRGQIGPSIPPWSQVEFFVTEELGHRSADTCVYQYLPAAKQTAFATLMTADMLNPQSLRYAENGFVRPWKFRAEAEVCNNDGYLLRNESDFSSIHAQLGGWFERGTPGIPANEQFSIARIHPNAAAYDATLYDVLLGTTEPTQYLVGRVRTDGEPFSMTVPGMASILEHYPTGEVLELTESTFVVKWREVGPADVTLYQRAAYQLDAEGLTVEWGTLATTLAAAPAPALATGAACNDSTTICYNHTRP
ncbi:MAG: hypothetical protein ACT4OF_16030 [Caulobacteraceae bacterium]